MSKNQNLQKNDSRGKEKVPLLLTGYLFALMILYAGSITMIGPIMPHLISYYGISLSQGGLIMTTSSIGGFLAILFGGLAADRFDKSKLVRAAYFVFGISLFLAGRVNVFILLLLVFFFLGTGSRMADTILNSYVADIYHARRGYYLNLLHTFFGFGALFGPIYARYIIDSDWSWQLAYTLLGIAAAALVLLVPLILSLNGIKLPAGQVPRQEAAGTSPENSPGSASRKEQDSEGKLAFIKRSPFIWFICLTMMLYLGHQSALLTWTPMYIETYLGGSPTTSSLALSVLWLGIILGRISSAYLTGKISAFTILTIGSLGGALFMTAGIIVQQPVVLVAALGCTGLLTGATIPLLVTIACNRYPEKSGFVSALIFLSGTLATMLFPWLTGKLAELFSFQIAMSLTWLVLFLMAGVVVPLRKFYYKV